MILQQQGAAGVPTPKKRKGNFKKSRLKLLKNKASTSDSVNQSSASIISAPLGMQLLSFAWWDPHVHISMIHSEIVYNVSSKHFSLIRLFTN